MIAQGSMMFIIDIDTENGGMQMNNDFCVDFGDEPDGPALAHEVPSKLKYQMLKTQYPRKKSAQYQIQLHKEPPKYFNIKKPPKYFNVEKSFKLLL